MEYIFNYEEKNDNLRIKLNPDNYVLSSFLWLLKKEEFPNYILQIIDSVNFGVENASFVFYYQMDWEDKEEFFKNFGKEILEDEIEIYFYDGKPNYSAVKIKDFEKVFYDYSIKLLEIYTSNGLLSNKWVKEMQQSIKKLKQKIKNDSN